MLGCIPGIGGSAVKSAVPKAAAVLVKVGDRKGNERKCVNRGFGGALGGIDVGLYTTPHDREVAVKALAGLHYLFWAATTASYLYNRLRSEFPSQLPHRSPRMRAAET